MSRKPKLVWNMYSRSWMWAFDDYHYVCYMVTFNTYCKLVTFQNNLNILNKGR